MPELHIRLSSSPLFEFLSTLSGATGAITLLLITLSLRYNAEPSVMQLYLKDLGDGRLCSKLGKNLKLPYSDRNEPKQAATPPLCRI